MVHESIPHPDNFCGGNFQDWLEVNLIEKCNAKCPWCVEKKGYHPIHHASPDTIINQALKTGKQNIILLGGEPTLYKDLQYVIQQLNLRGRKVWITTNGSKLNADWVEENLKGIHGVNISIHDWTLSRNYLVTGIRLSNTLLKMAILKLHEFGATVRFNCNCILGHVDTEDKIRDYIDFAKFMAADSVRFAELKIDEENFVDLAKIMGYKYGLNDDPFSCGCNKDAVVDGMPVNFRQMCGLQTNKRVKPINPVQHEKQVLYYDGKIYNGWQIEVTKEEKMKKNATKLVKVLEAVRDGKTDVATATAEIVFLVYGDQIYNDCMSALEKPEVEEKCYDSGAGCVY